MLFLANKSLISLPYMALILGERLGSKDESKSVKIESKSLTLKLIFFFSFQLAIRSTACIDTDRPVSSNTKQIDFFND